MNIKKKINNHNEIINLIFCFYPITFILGNTAININTCLIILITFIFFKKDLIEKLNKSDKPIFFFFLYTFFASLLNIVDLAFFSKINVIHFEYSKSYIFFKSFFYLRFFLLYVVIDYLIKKNILKPYNFFLLSSVLCLVVSFDLFIQFIFNKNILGMIPITSRKLSSFFGPELIAGSYLQRFGFFLFFFIIVFFNNNKKYLFFTISVAIIFLATVLTGNRMPSIMLFLGTIFIFIFLDEFRKYFIVFIFLISLIFGSLFVSNSEINSNYRNFYNHTYDLIKISFSKKINRANMPDYFGEFESFYDTWKLNKYFGGGIKSFRIYCPYRKDIDIDERSTCNTHPHNYYLEILTEIGIFGLIIVFFIIYTNIKKIYNFFYNKNIVSKNKNILLPFIILFLIEIFPIRNTGSFFSTYNATYIFILLGFLNGLSSFNNTSRQIKTK